MQYETLKKNEKNKTSLNLCLPSWSPSGALVEPYGTFEAAERGSPVLTGKLMFNRKVNVK